MLDQQGFDLWAKDYDVSVGLTDEAQDYPFAGYKAILNAIYTKLLLSDAETILDLGFGTGTLSHRLYEQGCQIYGQDFSEEMINIAKSKMPEAQLYRGDLTAGLVEALRGRRYDAIVASYALHHLEDSQKFSLIKHLLELLNEGGWLYIGDVAFETRKELEACKATYEAEWDEDEVYFVHDELKAHFPHCHFEAYSHCAGLFSLPKEQA